MSRMSRILSLTLMALISLFLVGCTSEADVSATLISPTNYVEQFESSTTPHLLIDVRTRQEYAEGFIEGSINIPVEELASRLSEVPQDIPVVVYCRSGNRSARAATILVENNYGEVYDLGGVIQWQQYGYRLTQGS
ncbi:MAG: rhodanese-like domain-containing protein [Anaerolineae bacterium]|nr:rhodanese-like domain-containing protein [Anaerolineae bacterium]